MLQIIFKKEDIAFCQGILEKRLRRDLKNKEGRWIGYQGGKIYNEIFYNENLWYSTLLLDKSVKISKDVKINRYWNVFGINLRKHGSQIITVEINPPIEGGTRRVAGLFAKDMNTGKYFLLHRGNVGGSRKGIGKNQFRDWYRGNWVHVTDNKGHQEEAILICCLSSSNMTLRITEFVHEVANFKNEITSDKNSRSAKFNIVKKGASSFNPEFYGKKSVSRKSSFEFECYHGLVVNALDKFIKKSLIRGQSTFNTALIDLGVQDFDGVSRIYEVKTTIDRQAIYTGIGQLLFHSAGNNKIEKYFVLPKTEFPEDIISILDILHIKLLIYSIVEGKEVIFEEK